ncbi:PREDICTED: protein DJ-1 homolog B-like [Prunus mume]|uniref:Protein DJ-1 homolog B-like n=1 Tax=Prunus mume TaxID=102107 RepID=A0ABM0NB15_PRUMU|nr:PREDICTED: protein DJ-1 homolog B-like [Prunus mume]
MAIVVAGAVVTAASPVGGTVVRGGGATMLIAGLWVEWLWAIADRDITAILPLVFLLSTMKQGGIRPGAANLKNSEVLESLVKKQAADGKLYATICASPEVAFGSWGVLKGLKATCYPSFMDQLASSATTVESRVQVDGKAVTSHGPGTTMDFAVVLVEQLYGKEKADEVSGPLVMHSNHRDEFIITELNPVEWTPNDSPVIT